MELYTFLMQFRGGTYISQVNADHLLDAMKIWGDKLETDGIQYLSSKGKSEILLQLKEIELSSINDTKNVWFTSLKVRTGFIALNVVKTSKKEVIEPLQQNDLSE